MTFSLLSSELMLEHSDPNPFTAVHTIIRTAGNGGSSTEGPTTAAESRRPLHVRVDGTMGDDEAHAGPSTSGGSTGSGGLNSGVAVAIPRSCGSPALGIDDAEGDDERPAESLPQDALDQPELLVDTIIVDNEAMVGQVRPGTVITRLRNVPSLEILGGRFGGVCGCPRRRWIEDRDHDCGKHSWELTAY